MRTKNAMQLKAMIKKLLLLKIFHRSLPCRIICLRESLQEPKNLRIEVISIPTMFDEGVIKIYSYNLETILQKKSKLFFQERTRIQDQETLAKVLYD